VLGAMPSDFISGYKTLGSKLTTAKKKDEAKGFAKMPTLKAVLPDDAQAAAAKKKQDPKTDDKVDDGVSEPDAKLPEKGNAKPQKGPKQKVSSSDDAKLKELQGMLDKLKSFFGSMVTSISTDSKVKTDPGKPPPVKLEGKSNPARAGKQEGEANTKIEGGHAKFAKAIDDGPGPQDVHRQPMEEVIPPKALPDVDVVEGAIDEGMQYYESITLTAKERETADKLLAPAVGKKMAKVDSDLEKGLDRQEKERDKAIEDGEKETEALNVEAQKEQEDIVAKTKKDIDAEQKKTKKKQDAEVKKAKKKGDKERRLVEKKVKKRREKDDKRVKGEFKKAKKKARDEKTKAHKKAKREKKKAEEKKKKQSWWDRVKSAVSSIVNAVCKVIGGIFDALGKLVSGIINAVKDLAKGIIDLACKFAKGLLDGLGKLLKGLVTGLLGKIFPELAKKLNEYIDKGIDLAKKGIDYVGDKLKKGVEAAANTVNSTIQKGLQVVKVGMQTAVRVAGCIATGDFKGAFLQVFYGACEIAGISRATAEKMLGSAKDTLKRIIDKPVAFIKNLIKAGAGGVKKFVSGFIGYLKKAFIDWIVGPLAKGGLKIPKSFNVLGILEMVLSALGITKEWALGIVEKKLGKKARGVVEKVVEYIEAFMKGGVKGVWEKIKQDVGNLWTMMLDFVVDYVKGKVVALAAEKLASLLAGPIGALWQIIKTAYHIYTVIRDKLDKIKTVLSSIFGMISDIARGSLGGAIDKVVQALVAALGIAIDLFAKIAGIGGIPKKIRAWVEKVGKKVRAAIEKVIDKIISKVKGLLKGGTGRDQKGKDKDKKTSPKLPPPTKFKTKDGKTHKLWAENKAGKLQLKVASNPIRVREQIAAWRAVLKDMPKETRKRAGSLIGRALSQEKKVDGLQAEKADEKKIKPAQETLAKTLKEIFEITSSTGKFAGIDPRETLKQKDYTEFKNRFVKTAAKVGMAKGDAEKKAESVWLKVIMKLQQSEKKYQQLPADNPGSTYKALSSDGYKQLVKDMAPIVAELDPLIKKIDGGKKSWAFWSGNPALKTAKDSGVGVTLETSALGSLFDELSVGASKSYAMELWGALSQAYARHAANQVEGKRQYHGFVGMGSSREESIFLQIEQPKFNKEVTGKPKITWYACAIKSKDKVKEYDPTVKGGGPAGTLGKAKGTGKGPRKKMVDLAEKENAKRCGGAENLYAHLKEVGDLKEPVESGFGGALKKAAAPSKRGDKMPKTLPNILVARPSLKVLFGNSNVGKSLTTSLRRVRAEVTDGQAKEERNFLEGSPWIQPLKKAVGAEMSVTVRLPTIQKAVLRKAKPELPAETKPKIVAWLKKQKGTGGDAGNKKPGDPKKLPKHPYTDNTGEKHTLRFDGPKGRLIRNPTPTPVIQLHDRGKSFQLAGEIQKLTDEFLGIKTTPNTGNQAVIGQIQKKLRDLEKAMAEDRGDNDAWVKKRKVFEKKLGGIAKTEAKGGRGKTALKYMLNWMKKFILAETSSAAANADKIDLRLNSIKALVGSSAYDDLLKKCGVPFSWGFGGSVDDNVDNLKEVLDGANSNAGTAVQLVIQFQSVMAEGLYKKTTKQIEKLLGQIGTSEKAIQKTVNRVNNTRKDSAGNKTKDKKREAQGKTLVSSTHGNPEMRNAKKSKKKAVGSYNTEGKLEMDGKTPSVPVEALTVKQLRFLAKTKKVNLKGERTKDAIIAILKGEDIHESRDREDDGITPQIAEKDPRSRSKIPVDDPDLAMSDVEKGQKGPDPDYAPFVQGTFANLIDAEHKYIKAAKALKMPLKAGISGNAHRFMNQAALMGAPLYGARLAVYGHLVTIKAHSFHEVMTASRPHCKYTDGKYLPFKPLPDADMYALAARTPGVGGNKTEQKKLLGEISV